MTAKSGNKPNKTPAQRPPTKPDRWDEERLVPRTCQAIVNRWGLPADYEFADFEQDVAVKLLTHPWKPGRRGGRSWPSWVYLVASSVWKHSVAKSNRRHRLAPMESYEDFIAGCNL